MKQTGVASVEGFSIRKKIVTLKLRFEFNEFLTSINLLQCMNTDVTVLAKFPDGEKAVNLGVYTIESNNFNKNHESLIVLKSLIDSINLDNTCRATVADNVIIRFLAVLELPDNE